MTRLAGAALAAMLALAAPAMGAGQSLAMLDGLEAGRWEVRVREPGVEPQRICMMTGRRLIQLRHPGAACETFVVQDSSNEVVVQYTCRGHGYGRTHIRRETGRLVQIDSRGIAGGLPFEFNAEARRVGDCSGT
ncbi:MAG: DUF3617 domain-containing protein [Novosphingobium sp.]